jgi:hypothetical protein
VPVSADDETAAGSVGLSVMESAKVRFVRF